MTKEEINTATGVIVDAAHRIHAGLGPGCLESVYEVLLAKKLVQRGFLVERHKPVSFEYDGIWFEEGFRPDLLVQHAIVVEIKAVEKLALVHERQLTTYLKILDYRVGLLLNFGARYMKDGIKRIVNNF